MLRRKRLACSFCGKGEAEVTKLVAGPKVYICDKCVALAARIIQGDAPDQQDTPHIRSRVLERLRARVGRFFGLRRVDRSAYQGVAP